MNIVLQSLKNIQEMANQSPSIEIFRKQIKALNPENCLEFVDMEEGI